MVAAFGLGAGRDALQRAIRYSQERVQGGGPLSQKQGYTHKLIVPNAVRLEAVARLHRVGGREAGRGRGRPRDRGRGRQVPGHRGRKQGRRGRDPGPRRVRLHARVHGREDQARRADHHDLRGHLRDHGVDDRARPLAAPPQEPGPVLPGLGGAGRRAPRRDRRTPARASPRRPCGRSARSSSGPASTASPATSTSSSGSGS